jgi:hypothetical protein
VRLSFTNGDEGREVSIEAAGVTRRRRWRGEGRLRAEIAAHILGWRVG